MIIVYTFLFLVDLLVSFTVLLLAILGVAKLIDMYNQNKKEKNNVNQQS